MLTEDRWSAILELVKEHGSVSVQELTEFLGISESTIRRDLVQLDKMNKLNRVHGGATSIGTQYIARDQTVTEKSLLMSREKELIGNYAATLVKPGDFVYIDAGTTTDRLVDALTQTGAVYVTNSITHARKLLHKGMRVIIPGGEIKAATEALVGAETVEAIRQFHFTIGFFGANGLSDKTGFTTPEMGEAMVKQKAIGHTERPYVLADNSKFQKVSPISFAEFDAAEIITDKIKDKRYKKYKHITEVEQS